MAIFTGCLKRRIVIERQGDGDGYKFIFIPSLYSV